MTADSIRRWIADQLRGRVDGSLDEANATNFLLAEIAAQLAELNAKATEPEIEKLRTELQIEIANWKPSKEIAAADRQLKVAVEWVLSDASFKAPEQIGQVAEGWIDRLREALR